MILCGKAQATLALQVRVWDVNTLKCLATLTGHSGAVRALAASSKRVFSGSDDTTIKVAPLTCCATPASAALCSKSGAVRRQLRPHRVTACAFPTYTAHALGALGQSVSLALTGGRLSVNLAGVLISGSADLGLLHVWKPEHMCRCGTARACSA